jgi:hypothetical protein
MAQATVITLGGALATPTGIKVKTDVLDIPQTLLIHDFSKTTTWPSQASTIPSGTRLVNLATQSPIVAKGFKASPQGMPFSAANKAITFTNASGVSNGLYFETTSAPFDHLPVEGLTTDILIIIWLKLTAVASANVFEQKNGGTALSNVQFSLPTSSGTFAPYAIGTSVTYTGGALTTGVWMQVGMYVRCQGYNGKSGIHQQFLNNVAAGSAAISATTFKAEDTTRELLFGGNTYGGFAGQIGRIAIVKGLDAAGLTPEALVAADWAANRSKWG